jgi:hypothetical protein
MGKSCVACVSMLYKLQAVICYRQTDPFFVSKQRKSDRLFYLQLAVVKQTLETCTLLEKKVPNGFSAVPI